MKTCLTENQARLVYDKIESGDAFKIRKIESQYNIPHFPKQMNERKEVNMYEKGLDK